MTWGSHKKSYLLNGSAIDVCLWRLCVYQRLSYRMVSYRNGVSTFSTAKKERKGDINDIYITRSSSPYKLLCLSVRYELSLICLTAWAWAWFGCLFCIFIFFRQKLLLNLLSGSPFMRAWLSFVPQHEFAYSTTCFIFFLQHKVCLTPCLTFLIAHAKSILEQLFASEAEMCEVKAYTECFRPRINPGIGHEDDLFLLGNGQGVTSDGLSRWWFNRFV